MKFFTTSYEIIFLFGVLPPALVNCIFLLIKIISKFNENHFIFRKKTCLFGGGISKDIKYISHHVEKQILPALQKQLKYKTRKHRKFNIEKEKTITITTIHKINNTYIFIKIIYIIITFFIIIYMYYIVLSHFFGYIFARMLLSNKLKELKSVSHRLESVTNFSHILLYIRNFFIYIYYIKKFIYFAIFCTPGKFLKILKKT